MTHLRPYSDHSQAGRLVAVDQKASDLSPDAGTSQFLNNSQAQSVTVIVEHLCLFLVLERPGDRARFERISVFYFTRMLMSPVAFVSLDHYKQGGKSETNLWCRIWVWLPTPRSDELLKKS